MRLAYFVHDLSDPAVAKRTAMLQAGGAMVQLLGFRRGGHAVGTIADAPAIDLGRTEDARLWRRAGSVALNLLRAPGWRDAVGHADVFLARNLEMLALAAAARRLHNPGARLVYECLDVHAAMLGPEPASRALRGVESALLNQCQMLIVSSPAFVTHYFQPLQRIDQRPGLTVLTVENKMFPAGGDILRKAAKRPAAGGPWRIGWFGMIRCKRSLSLLIDLATRRPELVDVAIRGRPAYAQFDDFAGQIERAKNVSFDGAYRAADLAAMYGGVHFNWSVDQFQDSGNSRWLLPNRLYEGGCFGAPPIAQTGVETGAWLARRGLGVLLDSPERDLEGFLDSLNPAAYDQIVRRHASVPISTFANVVADCHALAAALEGRRIQAAA